MPIRYLLCSFVVALLLAGCQRPGVDQLRWDAEVLVPLASGSIGIRDWVNAPLRIGTSQLDSADISLFARYPLYTLRLSDGYIDVPDTSYETAVKLDSLSLPDQSISYPVTLGQLARNDQSGQGQILILFHGNYFTIPAFNNLSSNNAPIDATSFFQRAVIRNGFMDIQIKNGFPVDITDLSFALKNASDGAIIVQDNIPLIQKGATVTKTYSLANKAVEGQLLADINNLNTPGSSGPVLIDTSDAIQLNITVRDLELRSAEAVFPAQNLVNTTNRTTYNMGGPEFTFMRIKSGRLVVTAVNTIEDSLYLDYAIPTAFDPNGQNINIKTSVPPATSGGSQEVNLTYDLAGYSIDLTSRTGDRVNTFDNVFRVSIDSTGKLIFITLDDSVRVYYGLLDIVPSYVRGYLGQEQIQIGPEVAKIGFFDQFTSGRLSFEAMDVQLRITNPFGVNGEAIISSIVARNTKTGETKTLSAPFIGQPVTIKRAYENPVRYGVTSLPLTRQNSNIDEVLGIFPDELEYNLSLQINPDGNYYNYQDFARFEDALVASLDMELPLSVQVEQLRLEETTSFNLTANTATKKITSGTLFLQANNGMPLSANVQAYFLDEQGGIIDSLADQPVTIAAGQLDINCEIPEGTLTKSEIDLTAEKVLRLRQATDVRFVITLNDAPKNGCGAYTKLSNFQHIDLNLSGKFIYAVGE